MVQTGYIDHYLFPSTLLVSKNPAMVTTILGSCVSVCLWDIELEFGGINHYMLPFWNGKGLASPKYGNIAINKLLEKMVEQGSNKKNLIAKVFGGGEVLQTKTCQFNIGERNIEVAKELLNEYNINVVGASTGGVYGRRIVFDTHKGTVIQRYIEKTTQIINYASTSND